MTTPIPRMFAFINENERNKLMEEVFAVIRESIEQPIITISHNEVTNNPNLSQYTEDEIENAIYTLLYDGLIYHARPIGLAEII